MLEMQFQVRECPAYDAVRMSRDRFESSAIGRSRLPGRTAGRGRKTGPGALIGAGAFLLAGIAVILIGTRTIAVDPSHVHGPYWIGTIVGTVFALAGLVAGRFAWQERMAESRRSKALLLRPDVPEMSDYCWDPGGYTPPRWRRAMTALGMAALLTLFLVPFNVAALREGGNIGLIAFVVLFDLVTVVLWGRAGLRLIATIKFGNSRIEFLKFPYRPGEPLALRWHASAGINHIRSGSFALRCVEETLHNQDSDNGYVTLEEIWNGTWLIDQPGTLMPGENTELRCEVPEGTPSTRLGNLSPLVCWELEVKLDLAGLDFTEMYLVPIYQGF